MSILMTPPLHQPTAVDYISKACATSPQAATAMMKTATVVGRIHVPGQRVTISAAPYGGDYVYRVATSIG